MFINRFEGGISETMYLDNRGNIIYCVKAWHIEKDLTLQLDFIDL